MEDRLIELLETFGYPVIRQGSMGEGENYPDSFFTFWNNDSSSESHYDNNSESTLYNYDVNFYSYDPSLTYSKLREAITLLKNNGFIIGGDGYDVASDEDTHTGRGVNALYLNF